MRRRMCLVGAALSVCPLAFGVGAAAAAKSKTAPAAKSKAAPVTTTVQCKTNVGVMIADGETGLMPPVSQGTEFGTASCGKMLGHGVQADSFTVPDSGTTAASFVLYFHTGSLHGTYKLVPQESSFNFDESDFLGTMKIAGGTGAFQGFKGTGTMTCSTTDNIHTTCKDHLTLKSKPTRSKSKS